MAERVQRRLRPTHIVFLANFGLAKIAVYAVPLLLAALCSDTLYGRLELGLAIGLQLSGLALGAPLSGITQLYLVRGERAFARPLILLTLIPSGALLLLGVITWFANADPAPALVIGAAGGTVVQNTASTWFRMRGERNAAAWVDGASLLIVGAATLVAVAVDGREAVSLTAALLLAATAVLVAGSATAWLRHERGGDVLDGIRRAAILGLPMMVAGVFAIWLGVGGRILVGLLSPADLAAYSVAFRIAGLTLGLQQLATTAMFPRLYASRVRVGDRLISLFLGAVLAFSMLILLIGPFLPSLVQFAALSGDASLTFARLIAPVVVQTFFWIAFALLQSRINRFGAAKSSIVPLMSVTLAGVALIIAASAVSADVEFIAWLIAAHAAAFFAVNVFVLTRRKLPHGRSARLGFAGGLALALMSVVMRTVS